MPMPPHHYPPGWEAFSRWVRLARAGGRCECTGQCGLHQHPTTKRRCIERNHYAAHYAHGKVILTTAHLCKCDPICLNPAHVIAACQRCHLRIDRFMHAAHRLDHQRHRREDTTDIRRDNTPKPAQSPGQPPQSPRE